MRVMGSRHADRREGFLRREDVPRHLRGGPCAAEQTLSENARSCRYVWCAATNWPQDKVQAERPRTPWAAVPVGLDAFGEGDVSLQTRCVEAVSVILSGHVWGCHRETI